MKDQVVSLKKLLDHMHSESDFSRTFYRKSSNEFITISDDIKRWVDDGLDVKDAPEWMQANIQQAIDIDKSYSEDYRAVPDQGDINPYDMMRRFSQRVNNYDEAMALLEAIDSRGAFRKFKALVTEFGLRDSWQGFKDIAYKEVAVEWCKRYGLPYKDDTW